MNRIAEITKAMSIRHRKKFGDFSVDLGDYLHTIGKASDAILYSILYMPELVLVDDSVLLSFHVEYEGGKEQFLSAISKKDANRQEIESGFNWVEVGYVFGPGGRDTSDEEDELLAQLIRDSWDGWLKASYPEREFVVQVIPAEKPVAPSVWVFTKCVNREKRAAPIHTTMQVA